MSPDFDKTLVLLTLFPNIHRSGRATQEPDLYVNQGYGMGVVSETISQDDLRSYQETVSRPDHQKWRIAMDEELLTKSHKDVFSLSDLPTGRKITSTCWVNRVKKNVN